MLTYTRQVQNEKDSFKSDAFSEFVLNFWGYWDTDATKSRYLRFHTSPRRERKYPGEVEAERLLRYLLSPATTPQQRRSFVSLIRAMQEQQQPTRGFQEQSPPESRRRQRLDAVLDKVKDAVSAGNRAVGVARDGSGLILKPTTEYGIAAVSAQFLFEERWLTRIRRCLKCKTWFFARFKHQKFCSNRETKCQWNHYHTPGWRKQHRERNRRHQAEYRKRNPGRRH